MGTEVLKIYIVLGIFLVIILGAGFYYVFNESVPDFPVDTNNSNPFYDENAAQNQFSNSQTSTLPKGLLSDIEELARAKIQIVTNGKNKIVVHWENLPDGTNRIVIFRSRTGGTWVRWKTISIESGASGSTEITLSGGENASSYSFYAQAFSPVGYTLWASQITQAQPPPPPPSESSTSTATTTGQIAQGGSPPPGNQNPPPSTPTSTPSATSTSSTTPPPPSGNTTTTPPVTPPPSGPPVAYYTPNGEIAGYFVPQLDPFFVTHVNQNIEISWQNLPPPTETIVVYRSQNQNGPWKELLRQEHPSTSTRDFVRLVDYTTYDSYYYRMDALSGSGAVLAAYEPIYLPGIGQ